MSVSPLNVLELGGLCGLVLSLVGFGSLLLGSYKARREFRVKGFLRPPSGLAWFRFLLFRQYEYFEGPGIRVCFSTSHSCLIGFFFVAGAVVLFLGSEIFFNGTDGFTLTGQTIPLPW